MLPSAYFIHLKNIFFSRIYSQSSVLFINNNYKSLCIDVHVKQSFIIITYKCTHIIILYLIVLLFMPLLCTLCLCLYSILKYFSSDVHGDPPYNYYKKCCILIKTLVVMDSVVAILLLSLISATVSETGYQVIFSRADDVVRNNFTLTCQSTSTGLGLSNAKWLFNEPDK